MEKEQLNRRVKGAYVVVLPERGLGVPAYGSIPQIGTTKATSEAGAVSQYVMRHTERVVGRTILARLGVERGGLSRFAYAIPEFGPVEGGEPFTPREIARHRTSLLALDIAERNGREDYNEADLKMAIRLLKRVGYAAE